MARLTTLNGCESPARMTSFTFAAYSQVIEKPCESRLSHSKNSKLLISLAKVAKVVLFDFRRIGNFIQQVIDIACESQLSQSDLSKYLKSLAKVAKVHTYIFDIEGALSAPFYSKIVGAPS